MRSIRSLLLILPCFVAMATADPLPPSLVWTADPITSFTSPANSPDSGASAFATDTGMGVNGSCIAESTTCYSEYAFVRTFTVTSPGTFVASGSLTDDILAFNCVPDFCYPSATATGSFTVSGDFIDLSDAGSAVNSSSDCVSLGCEVFLNLSDTESSLVTLADGNYALAEQFTESAVGNGDTSLDFNGTFSLVPTPEPRYGFAVVALALLIVLWRKTRASAAELS